MEPATNSANIDVRFSEALRALPWSFSLGTVIVRGINSAALQSALAWQIQSFFSEDRTSRQSVVHRIRLFESFFVENGFCCPLGEQFEAIRRKGSVGGSPLVQALVLSEMTTGLLMGAQDAAAIKQSLLCDIAGANESFRGMRGDIRCRKGEIVLRDDEGIIATLLQGPDHRTRLKKDTKDVAFFVFSVPGIGGHDLQEAVHFVCGMFQAAGAEISSEVFNATNQVKLE